MNAFDSIRQMIYEVRGVKVMLDADLAALYGYTTKAFNQQVKNNIAKFDADFRFQLTREEYREILMSKNMTSRLILSATESSKKEDDKISRSNFLTLENGVSVLESKDNDRGEILRSNFLTLELEQGKYSKFLPYVFTEQGIYMLMTVLKGDLATKQSKALIRTFKEMKDFIVDNKSLIGSNELVRLSLQTAQNTADIADIKSEMLTKSNLTEIIRDFSGSNVPNEYLILNGESVDADIAYNTIYASAKREIFVIDNYIGLRTLVMLKNVKPNVRVTIFSDNIANGLHQKEFEDFSKQYPKLKITFRKTSGIYHDKYIVVDYNAKNEHIYHCGASSKDAGNKVTTITEVSDKQVYRTIIEVLLQNPELSLPK
jgi:hypothetical protein